MMGAATAHITGNRMRRLLLVERGNESRLARQQGPTQPQERARAPSPPPSRQRRTCKIFAETNLRQALIVKGLQRIRGVALLLWHLLSQSSDLRGDSKIDRLGVEVIHELSKQT